MSLVALLAPGPATPASGTTPRTLGDAMLPRLPRLATITVTPANAAEQIAALGATQAAEPIPRRSLVEIIYTPGEYRGVGIWQGFALSRSSTGNPEDVIVSADTTTGGVLHWWGAHTWIKGITLRSLPSTDGGPGAKYPLHMTGGGTLTLIDCHLDAANPGSDGGPAIIGADGGDNLDAAFVGCRFTNLTGSGWTNIHGGTPGPLGRRWGFIDCQWGNDPATPTPISYASPDNGEQCDLWMIGGNTTPGANSTADVRYHTDGGWPATVGGFTARDRLALGIT